MKHIFSILIFLFVLIFNVSSQSFNFTNYTINEGLSQSVVNCIFQDSRGFIWIGTQNGLNRFNGESFEIFNYNPIDSTSISNNWIYAITEDNDENIWIGTKGGLNKYNTRKNRFERISYQTEYTYDVTLYSYNVISLKNGNIGINTPPVFSIYYPENKRFEHFVTNTPYDGRVKDVIIPAIEDEEGNIWVGSTKGLTRLSLKTKQLISLKFIDSFGNLIEEVNVTALFKGRNGKLWAGTTIGLFLYNSDSENFEESHLLIDFTDNSEFVIPRIKAIEEDNNGNLIFGTESMGLFHVTPKKIQNYTEVNSRIAHNNIQYLMIDGSENLWIGNLKGISKTDLKKKKFKLYRNALSPNSTDLLGNVIASLYKDEEGIIWAGNWGQGLNKINRETGEVEHFSRNHSGNHKITNDFVHVIFKDAENKIWLGTRDGIHVYNKPQNTFVPLHEYFKNPDLHLFDEVRIYMIIQDKEFNYWIGTQNGLYKINREKSKITVFQNELEENLRLSSNLVYYLLQDSDGLIWIATAKGLDIYDPVNGKMNQVRVAEVGLGDDLIISLCEDSKKRIWIGTSAFLYMFDKKDSTFRYYSQKHGLPNNNIFEIVEDKNEGLWFATGKGLSKFIENEKRFQTFTPEDGLQSLEFNLRAAYVCEDGEILLGGMDGFNSFYPESISKNNHKPNVVFTSFYKTNGADREYLNLEEENEIVLKYNESSFTIEFAALEYTNPQKNMYRYKMEGISDNWIDIENRKFMSFSGLKPGDYNFKVQGSNNDGIWNENKKSLNIIVLPPWWRSRFAYLVYFIILVLAIVTFIKIRERRLQHDKKILEQKVHERTLQIEKQKQLIVTKNEELEKLNHTKNKLFSIIGHDLGNQFNIILGFLDLLKSDFKKLDPEKIEYHLTNIYNSSNQAHDLLENLLTWARMQTNSIQFNPESFNIQQQVEKSLQLLEGAAAKKKINIEVITSEEIPVYADVNMFSTIFRNLVGNAIKFTPENGKISISFKRENNFCAIKVKDNGVGISDENITKIFRIDSKHKTLGTNGEKGTGLGLILCKEFVEKNGGKIWVESEQGKGSRFVFTVPSDKNG